mmetsp:Transcript_13536/g.35848  ORF Transcript_13536/g.35848 Transcript_13536/m.35848 type:complete len:205 (-) Transcript_13536:575-1189(-)
MAQAHAAQGSVPVWAPASHGSRPAPTRRRLRCIGSAATRADDPGGEGRAKAIRGGLRRAAGRPGCCRWRFYSSPPQNRMGEAGPCCADVGGESLFGQSCPTERSDGWVEFIICSFKFCCCDGRPAYPFNPRDVVSCNSYSLVYLRAGCAVAACFGIAQGVVAVPDGARHLHQYCPLYQQVRKLRGMVLEKVEQWQRVLALLRCA